LSRRAPSAACGDHTRQPVEIPMCFHTLKAALAEELHNRFRLAVAYLDRDKTTGFDAFDSASAEISIEAQAIVPAAVERLVGLVLPDFQLQGLLANTGNVGRIRDDSVKVADGSLSPIALNCYQPVGYTMRCRVQSGQTNGVSRDIDGHDLGIRQIFQK